jgi:hypothetical protein
VKSLVESGLLQIVAVTDPITLGFGVMASVGVRVSGDAREAAETISQIDEVDYCVLTSGPLRPAARAGLPRQRAPAQRHQRPHPDHRRHPRDRDLDLPARAQADLHLRHAMSGAPGPLLHPFAKPAAAAGSFTTMVRGEGALVFDREGRRYVDAMASLWHCNVGHGRPEVAAAVAQQLSSWRPTTASSASRTRAPRSSPSDWWLWRRCPAAGSSSPAAGRRRSTPR